MPHSVLLIEDDAMTNRIAKEIINALDFADSIRVCTNGKDAIDFFESALKDNPSVLPDIIFLDINMPVMDGWQFLEAYKKLVPQINKKILIFMQSSSAYEIDMQRAKSYNEVTDYILKPLDFVTLERIRNKYLKTN